MAGTNRVYPFLWFERQKYIGKWTDNECDAVDKMSRESIALHWWNKMIKFDKDQPEQDRVHVNSVIFKVMQKHCPSYIYTQGAESMGVDVKQ